MNINDLALRRYELIRVFNALQNVCAYNALKMRKKRGFAIHIRGRQCKAYNGLIKHILL